MNGSKIIGGGVDLSHLAARAQQRSGPQQGFTINGQQARAAAAGSSAGAGQHGAAAGAGSADSVAAAAGPVGAADGAADGAISGAGLPASGANNPAQTVDIPAVVFPVADATLDNAVQLSAVVPVVLLLTSAEAEAQQPQQEVLAGYVRQMGGKIALGVIDAAVNPQIVAALAPETLPTAVLLLGRRPELLYQGAQSAETLAQVLPQIVALAAQQGITGVVSAPDLIAGEGLPAAAPEPQLNPEHQAAFDAAQQGDYKTAIAEYEKVLAKAPRDDEASAALAQVKLLDRLNGKTMQEIREAAAADPQNLEKQMLVADLDISGGHFEDGFLRLLELFERSAGDDRAAVQKRLLELFEVVGVTDPTVVLARRKLANLLY